MKAPKIPTDLADRYGKLIYELDHIRQIKPKSGDPRLARMGSAMNALIDFLSSPEFTEKHPGLLAPFYDILEQMIEQRTAEAETARRGGSGGRPRVDLWTSVIRAVAIAAVDLMHNHDHSRLEARKIVASQLRAAGYEPIPSHATIKQWETDWLPRQAQRQEFSQGHLPPETVRQAALVQMEERVAAGAETVALSSETLKSWIINK